MSTPTSVSTTNPTANSSSSNNNTLDGLTQEEEERRCEQVAQLLLEGMKGEELAKAVRNLDRVREEEARPTTIAMPIPTSPFGFGYGMYSNSGLTFPPTYTRRSSSVPLPNGSSDFFLPSFAGYPAQALDMSAIAIPSVPFMSQTRPSSPINNISRQRTFGHRRSASAQPVIRRSWTLPNNNTHYNTDFSGFDWSSYAHTQIQRDDVPLPAVELELFNGFTFDGGVVDASLSSSASSASSVSDHNSPWIETASHGHSQHLAIAPHDLPPLDVSSTDMNWHSGATTSGQSLLSATSSCSSSSAFPSPSLSSTSASTHDNNGKVDPGMTPTNAMFDHLNLGYGLDMNGGVGAGGMGVDYTYAGYNDMGFGVGDMGMGMGYAMAPPQRNELGMGVVDTTIWNA